MTRKSKSTFSDDVANLLFGKNHKPPHVPKNEPTLSKDIQSIQKGIQRGFKAIVTRNNKPKSK